MLHSIQYPYNTNLISNSRVYSIENYSHYSIYPTMRLDWLRLQSFKCIKATLTEWKWWFCFLFRSVTTFRVVLSSFCASSVWNEILLIINYCKHTLLTTDIINLRCYITTELLRSVEEIAHILEPSYWIESNEDLSYPWSLWAIYSHNIRQIAIVRRP